MSGRSERMDRWLIGACALLGICLAAAAAPAPTVPYAVIEIGASGVKSYLFDMDRAAHDSTCFANNDAYLKCVNPQSLNQINCNPISDSPLFVETGKAVGTAIDNLKTKNGIPDNRIFIVGSSSLAKEFQRDLLVTRITNDLHPANAIDFVNVEQETTYGFKGVLGMLPGKWRAIRTPQATMIDIGSGNTKGSYETTEGGERMVFFGVDNGTKNAAKEITAAKQEGESFRQAADKWRTTVFLPKLQTEIERKTGISSRNRVYMIGGIVWALENHLHPDDTSKFPQIQPSSIDTLLNTASADDAQSKLCNDERKDKYPEIKKACDVFTPKDLVAGLEIFKAISEELGFAANHKTVFFFRDSLYAWPLGYLGGKLSIAAQLPNQSARLQP